MKSLLLRCIFGVLLLLNIAACGGGGSTTTATGQSDTGSVNFNLDISALKSGTASNMQSAASEMTGVTVTLSRDGYDDIVQELTVAGDTATGTVTGLASGYWHIEAKVYSNATVIYAGSVDVKIVSDAQVSAEILFDPVDPDTDPATTGSVVISVGMNKLPGYKKINQYVSAILQDTVNSKFYILDNSTGIVAVYNANTLVREKDIALQNAPQAVTVDAAGDSLLLGYSTGKIYRLKISDESLTLVADSLISVTALVPFSSKYLLVTNGSSWGASNYCLTINLENGQVVSSKNYSYPLSSFTHNPVNGMVYALDSGLSPADMHHIKINADSGAIETLSDSKYHGDYSFGAPVRVIMSGSRIATASGNMFISTTQTSEDITYAGNLGHPYVDLASDDSLGNLYMLNSDNIKKLLVYKQDTLFVNLTVDLLGEPKRIFNTPGGVVVFVAYDNAYYAKIFNKTSLGLM